MKYLFALVVAAIAFAAPAHADPEGDYVNNILNQPGMAGGALNNALYVMIGHHACDLMRSGVTPQDTANQLVNPWVTPYIARTMVTAAQGTLC